MRELLQQALDVIKDATQQIEAEWIHDYEAGREAIAKLEAELAKPEQPQTDLRKAAEMALDALEKKYGSWGKGHDILNLNAIVSLRQALIDSDATLINEATKPERNFCTRCGKRLGDGIHTCTPPEQEPVAWMQDSIELYVNDRPTSIYTIPLYTKPPKREWQGLTDDDLDKCDAHETWRSMRNVAQMLKEKNT